MGLRLYYVSVPDTAIDDLREQRGLARSLLRGWNEQALVSSTSTGRGDLLPLPLDLVSRLPARISDEFVRRGLRFHPASPPDQPRFEESGTSTALMDSNELPPWMRVDAVRGSLGLAWHAIHFVLTGSAGPVSSSRGFLMQGGEPVGHGRRLARFLTGAQVREIRSAIRPIDANAFEARFEPAALARQRVHPPIWDRDREALIELHAAHYQILRRDIDATVSAGEGLLLGRL